MSKTLRTAFAEGAKAKRAGITPDRVHQFYDSSAKYPQPIGTMKYAWMSGWEFQALWPDRAVTSYDFELCFDMERLKMGLLKRTDALTIDRKEMNMGTRSAEELEQLKADYRTNTYDPYVAGLAEGQQPQDFDAAFAAHLEALDAADIGKAKPKGAKPTKPAKPAKAKGTKEAKAKGPSGFRPSSDDRKALNAAADKAKGKAEGTARLLPQQKGATYTDFLQGKVLKVDAEGNGETTLNVVTTKSKDTVVGTVTVTVKKGVLTAKAAKA